MLSSGNFIILDFTFELIFVCGVRYRLKFVCIWIAICSSIICWKAHPFFTELSLNLVENLLTKYTWVCFCTLTPTDQFLSLNQYHVGLFSNMWLFCFLNFYTNFRISLSISRKQLVGIYLLFFRSSRAYRSIGEN